MLTSCAYNLFLFLRTSNFSAERSILRILFGILKLTASVILWNCYQVNCLFPVMIESETVEVAYNCIYFRFSLKKDMVHREMMKEDIK